MSLPSVSFSDCWYLMNKVIKRKLSPRFIEWLEGNRATVYLAIMLKYHHSVAETIDMCLSRVMKAGGAAA